MLRFGNNWWKRSTVVLAARAKLLLLFLTFQNRSFVTDTWAKANDTNPCTGNEERSRFFFHQLSRKQSILEKNVKEENFSVLKKEDTGQLWPIHKGTLCMYPLFFQLRTLCLSQKVVSVNSEDSWHALKSRPFSSCAWHEKKRLSSSKIAKELHLCFERLLRCRGREGTRMKNTILPGPSHCIFNEIAHTTHTLDTRVFDVVAYMYGCIYLYSEPRVRCLALTRAIQRVNKRRGKRQRIFFFTDLHFFFQLAIFSGHG